MWDPGLADHSFRRDRVRYVKPVISRDALAALEGATRADDIVTFSAPGPLRLILKLHETNLSEFNALSVLVHNYGSQRLLVGMTLVHGPESRGEGIPDISLSGGRAEAPPGAPITLLFPKEGFGTYGTASDWSDVREIELSFGWEKTETPHDLVKVGIGTVEGVCREIPEGPRLTLEGLAEVLRSRPDDVIARIGHDGSCTRGFEPYISTNSALWISPPHPYPFEGADRIIQGYVMGQKLPGLRHSHKELATGITTAHHPPPSPSRQGRGARKPSPLVGEGRVRGNVRHQEPPDFSAYALPELACWDFNPLGALEWTHFLNRHHFLRELVQGLYEREDHRYAQALDRYLSSWIATSPVPVDSNGGAGPAWETLSAAWRLREWLWVIGTAWPNSSFSRETKLNMLCSIWEHSRSLMDHQGHPNNWLIVESAALALAGICFPEFTDAETWAQEGITRLTQAFEKQFFTDGVHFEISPMYHAICVHALLEVREAAYSRGIPLPDLFDEPLERSFDYLAALCRPDFTWPSLNDSGGMAGDYTGLMTKAAEVFKRADYAWVGNKGRQGCAPSERLRAFPQAGIAVMRSGYERDSHHLVFRAGPQGAAHVHEDVLSLDVTAFGIPRLVDPGITTYAPGPWTDYYRSAAAHNTILVDGKGPDYSKLSFGRRIEPPGKDFSWSASEDALTVTGIFRGPWKRLDGEVCFTRKVIFVREQYWVVWDAIDGEGEHEVTACWQFAPGRVEMDLKTYTARCVDEHGPRFELIPALHGAMPEIQVFTGAVVPPRGWVSKNGTDLPATTVMYGIRAALPLVLTWLLLPFS
ncbi:MAG: alginate lyase family protein [Thermodesulfobacteriota bacterium]